jgi:hypothetical protein
MYDLDLYDESSNVLDHFTQWDVGRQITIKNSLFSSLTEAPLIHFANSQIKEALVAQSSFNDDGDVVVNIPNEILETALLITIYVYVLHDTVGKTVLQTVIPVVAKTKPSDYKYVENFTYYTRKEIIDEINIELDAIKARLDALENK